MAMTIEEAGVRLDACLFAVTGQPDGAAGADFEADILSRI